MHPAENEQDVVAVYATAVWSVLAEPGDGTAGALIASVGPVHALQAVADDHWRPPASAGVSREELQRARARWRPRASAAAVRETLATAARAGVRLITRADPAWPDSLDDLGRHAPVCLWVRGDAHALSMAPSIALVGARAATSYGEHVAAELASELAGAGVLIVSGGAYGIDGAAHRAALGAGGSTVAFSAGGVDRPYPAGHAQLLERVAAGGALVAEVPCGSAPTKWRFLQRNRLIACLADGVVVVEAGWRSGSLNTAGHAAALGRPLGAVPGPITSAASAGCHRLLREYGAECITSAADARMLIGVADGPESLFGWPARTDDTTRVRDALSSRSPRTVPDISTRCGMSEDEVEAILGVLELEEVAGRTAGGWRRTTPGSAAAQ